MDIKVSIQSIANAPKDRPILLIDVMADSPRWGLGVWIADRHGFFDGDMDDYREACADVEAGQLEEDDVEMLFWAEPTHWCETLPIPLN